MSYTVLPAMRKDENCEPDVDSRTKRNDDERKGRDNMKYMFTCLKNELPSLRNEVNPSKDMILKEAIHYFRCMKKKNKTREKQIKYKSKLMRTNRQKQIQELEKPETDIIETLTTLLINSTKIFLGENDSETSSVENQPARLDSNTSSSFDNTESSSEVFHSAVPNTPAPAGFDETESSSEVFKVLDNFLKLPQVKEYKVVTKELSTC